MDAWPPLAGGSIQFRKLRPGPSSATTNRRRSSRRRTLIAPCPPPWSSMLVTASEMHRMVRWRWMSSRPACCSTSSTASRARCRSGGVGDLEIDDGPAQCDLGGHLVVVEDAELAAGDGGREVVEDLDEAPAVVSVVALPAVGPDAEDVAGVALRHEAQLVGHEVVGLRHGVAHEGLAREGFGRVGDAGPPGAVRPRGCRSRPRRGRRRPGSDTPAAKRAWRRSGRSPS